MLFKRLIVFWLVVALQPVFHLFAAHNENTHTLVRFCAPQHNVYPFFMTEDGELTGINHDMMLQVFNNATLPDATLRYVQRPWKRCNADLESGVVDMMIGGYDPKRDNVAYPLKLGFDLADTILSTADVCFFSIAGPQFERTRRGMEGQGEFIVGIQAGFSKQHNNKIKPQWVELFNPTEKYRMLEKGRLDAIIQVCAMDGTYLIEPRVEAVGLKKLEALHPAYLSNPAYVVFSDKFANEHRELAKRIVMLSLNIDKAKVYSRYRPRH
jgi:hypothetical protein